MNNFLSRCLHSRRLAHWAGAGLAALAAWVDVTSTELAMLEGKDYSTSPATAPTARMIFFTASMPNVSSKC